MNYSQCSSVAQSCPTLCNPMDCSMLGLSVHHQLPEFIQTHVPSVSNAIQLSHPLSSPSPPTFNLSQHQGFSNESVLLIRWPKYWNFSFNICPSNEHSGLISLGWTGCIPLQSKGISTVFSNTAVQKHSLFSAQLPLNPTLTSIHDYLLVNEEFTSNKDVDCFWKVVWNIK